MVTTTTKRGRKSKPFTTKDGSHIDGLYHRPNSNQYRILATGEEYRANDEEIAIARFRQWEATQIKGSDIRITSPADASSISDVFAGGGGVVLDYADDGDLDVVQLVSPKVFWPWLRRQFLTRPEWLAAGTGLPQVASYASLPLPRPSPKLETLIKEYEKHSDSGQPNLTAVRRAFDKLTKHTGATTLADLTQDVLVAFADHVKAEGNQEGYANEVFARIKRVIKYGLKRGIDGVAIRSALDACAVLDAPKRPTNCQPSPISREDFRKLLDKAEPMMKAALLLSLNCCLYASEAMGVCWEDLNLKARTYLDQRNKTQVIRAGYLWRETVEALKALQPRESGPVFRSSTGLSYHPNSFRKLFDKARKAAQVPVEVEYNNLRDGAYTAACVQGVEFHLTQILAGHRHPGQSDQYVARNPAMVQPACEAIYRAYFGK